MKVLCVNTGSSSLKLAIYATAIGVSETCLTSVTAGEIGTPESYLKLDGKARQPSPIGSHHEALELALGTVESDGINAIGHRIVHGGPRGEPALVNESLLEELKALVPLAPLHMPPAIAAIDHFASEWPALPQVACFDTAFHSRMPELARRFPLPEKYFQAGVCRYGFHGLSYEYLVSLIGNRLQPRCILAHLGNGASLVALKDGAPEDTSMGLTPMGGVMMGTRSGDLDPGVLLHLMRRFELDATGVEGLLDRESGLLGVSGLTSDMSELIDCAADSYSARMAINLFSRSVSKAIGSLSVVIGGLDQLVFTAGIGENAPAIRSQICNALRHLGVVIDPKSNHESRALISSDESSCAVEVLHTDEDAMIARHTAALVNS